VGYQKILAVKLRALGDTVILTASLRALTEKFPGAQVDVVIPEAYFEILRGFPGIGRVFLWPQGSKFKPYWSLLPELRAEKYDAVLNFHASPSTAQFCRFVGARERVIHFHGHRDENRFSTLPIAGKGEVKPIIERDLDGVRALGVVVNPGSMKTQVMVSRRHGAKSKLILSPGASRPTKQWPLKNFETLARNWQTQGGEAIYLLGPNEREWASQLGSSAVVSDSLSKTLDLMASATLFVGNDSGPKHLAVAIGLPTFTLFGPEDPFEWHPYSRVDHPVFFREGLSCRVSGDKDKPAWCGIQVCTVEKHRCMRDITVEEVWAKILPFAPNGK